MHFHPPARSATGIDLPPETHAFLLSEAVDVNAALRNISTQARVLTDATGVAIALAHKNSMICRASVGHAPSLGSRLDIASGISGECVRSGKALRCDDSESDARVDLASCRRLGIRSIVAIPIRAGDQTIGLMEVFSPKPRAFTDWHLSVLRRLVNSPLLSSSVIAPTLSDFALEIESANTALADKPVEVPMHPLSVAVNSTSSPAQFWSDVFVQDALPWKRFAQSLGLHIVMIATLASFVRFVLNGPRAVQPRFNSSDVLYYSSSEYFGQKRQKLLAPRLKTRRAALPDEPVISVPREQGRRAEKFVPAPDVRLKPDKHNLPMMAWSSVSPSIPASAVMRNQFNTPTAPVSVVAPAPDLAGLGTRRPVGNPRAAVIEPPPSVGSASRQVANTTIGALQIISPPPQITMGSPNSNTLAMQAGLHDDVAAVVAPSPSLKGIHLSGAQARSRAEVGGAQVVPPPPQVSATGNSRRQAGGHDELASVIGPSPSLAGIEGSGGLGRARSTAPAAQVVPPPPQISGAGSSRSGAQAGAEIAVVSPPPSVTDPGSTLAGHSSTRGGASPSIVPLAPAAKRESGGAAPSTTNANVLPPMEDIGDDDPPTDRKELSIAPLAPAAALASSSYFASSEIFIAEERLGSHRKRYIKLVYDYLPYQKRLSEYGPNYPQVDKLRATRDVSCDESLAAGAYSISQAEVSRPNGSPSQEGAMYQDRLPCFRTTADDYRRALEHHSKPHSGK